MRRTAIDEIVSCPSLPTLPTVALELLELTRNPEVELIDIARVVESDPGLASRILKTVNSSLYGLREPCASIQRALAYLGLNAVKSLALGFSLVDVTRMHCGLDSFDLVSYWRHSIYGAVAARHLATTCGNCDPDEAFTCGMFQDMGMFAAYVALGGSYSKLLVAAEGDMDQLMLLEQEQLGFNHLDAGAALCERWQFPKVLIDCIRHIGDPDSANDDAVREMARIVALGRMMAELLNVSDPEAHLARIEALITEWYAETTVDTTDALHSINAAALDLADVLDQDIGEEPDIEAIRRRAEEQSVQLQLAVQREIEDLRNQRTKLASAAFTDALTGIGNRAKFDAEVRSVHQHSLSEQQPYAVIFIDVDHFKNLNDLHGHQVGDVVLREVAQRIRLTIGSLGEVFRYGGEEFVAMFPGWNAERAVRFAELIRAAVADSPFLSHPDDSSADAVAVTVSLGVAAFDALQDDGVTSESLLRLADEALYEAKRAGRNCVFGPSGASEFSADNDFLHDESDEAIDRPGAEEHRTNEAAIRAVGAAPSTSFDSAARTTKSQMQIVFVEPDPLAATLLRAVFAAKKDVRARYLDDLDSVFSLLPSFIGEPAVDHDTVIVVDVTSMITHGFGPLTRLRQAVEGTSTRIIAYSVPFSDSIQESVLNAGADEAHEKATVARNLSSWITDLLNAPTYQSQSAA